MFFESLVFEKLSRKCCRLQRKPDTDTRAFPYGQEKFTFEMNFIKDFFVNKISLQSNLLDVFLIVGGIEYCKKSHYFAEFVEYFVEN